MVIELVRSRPPTGAVTTTRPAGAATRDATPVDALAVFAAREALPLPGFDALPVPSASAGTRVAAA